MYGIHYTTEKHLSLFTVCMSTFVFLVRFHFAQSFIHVFPSWLNLAVPQPVVQHFHNTLLRRIASVRIQNLLTYSEGKAKLVPARCDLGADFDKQVV